MLNFKFQVAALRQARVGGRFFLGLQNLKTEYEIRIKKFLETLCKLFSNIPLVF